MLHIKNVVGNKYGRLTVLDQKREDNRTWYYCKCDCGNKKWIRADGVTSGNVLSCGCYNKKFNQIKPLDITGKVFGRLKAIAPTDKRDKNNGSVIWKCKCSCGNYKYVSVKDLQDGSIKSCGCLGIENSKHNGIKIGKLTKEHCIENTNVRNLTMSISKRNTSGIKGVCWDKERNKWKAQIRFKNKNYYLGRYAKKEDAIKARKQAENKMFGEFLEWYYKEYKGE